MTEGEKLQTIIFRRLKYIWLIFGLLLVLACKNQSSVNITSTEFQKSPSVNSQNQTTNEVLDKDEKLEKQFAIIWNEKNSPIKIIDLVDINGKGNFKKGVEIKIQNVSDKAISSVKLGFVPPFMCNKLPYLADSIFDVREITESNQLLTKTAFSIYVPAKVAANLLKEFKECSPENRKSNIYIWNVQFNNGETWKAKIWNNNREE